MAALGEKSEENIIKSACRHEIAAVMRLCGDLVGLECANAEKPLVLHICLKDPGGHEGRNKDNIGASRGLKKVSKN